VAEGDGSALWAVALRNLWLAAGLSTHCKHHRALHVLLLFQHLPGQQYSGVYLRMDDIPFVKTDKQGNATDVDYAGYAIVAGPLATKMAQYIKKKTG
jgi:hypothetical protein